MGRVDLNRQKADYFLIPKTKSPYREAGRGLTMISIVDQIIMSIPPPVDNKKTVFVGLSGGVDSGTSAALLKERGYDVIGFFIKIWQPEFIECTWREDRLDAMRIAAALGIPFREIDLSNEYKREVVDAMVRDYGRGITPNPDVLCNEKIKFGAFARWAFAQGAGLIATGHYARKEIVDGEARLLRGRDPQKDQSYFLYRIQASDLERTLFPIGDMFKFDVRERAKSFGLPVASKPDSQGLCFVGDVSMRDFLARFITLKPGAVLDLEGNVIGEHDGAPLYTIGQRHGFKVKTQDPLVKPGLTKENTGYFERLVKPGLTSVHYVVGVSIQDNTITVSADHSQGEVREVALRDMHWIGEKSGLPLKTSAQSRYREKPFSVTLKKIGGEIIAIFDEPHLVSSGQSLVLYEGDRVLGGGIIQRAP